MTSKKKAEELVGKYMTIDIHDEDHFITRKQRAKNCALIAVDNAMDALRFLPYGLDYLQQIDFWEEVKQEIEKL